MIQYGIQILVVDSQRLFSSGLVEMLRNVSMVRWADSLLLEDIPTYPRERTPDLVLFSPRSNWTPGTLIQETRRVRFFFPKTRLVYLLDRVGRMYFHTAVELQLDGCWTKRWHFVQLCRAIQQVMNGEKVFRMDVDDDQRHVVSTVTTRDTSFPISRVERLTPREFQIFQWLASGFSVRECAENLGLAKSTVENHKMNLMRKLQVHKTVQLAWLAANDQWMSKPMTPQEIAIQTYNMDLPMKGDQRSR